MVYALITETIYGTERVIKLDTGQVWAIIIVEVLIKVSQRRGFHFHDFIFVIGKRHIETQPELTDFDHVRTIDIEFPTVIAHFPDIGPRKRRETGRRRNVHISHQKFGCHLGIDIEISRNPIIEQS